MIKRKKIPLKNKVEKVEDSNCIKSSFFKEVVGKKPPRTIPESKTLVDYIEDSRFEKEFLEMFIDKTQLIFDVNIRRQIKWPVHKIIQYLEVKNKSRQLYRKY